MAFISSGNLSGAYLSDTETSQGNTITAWVDNGSPECGGLSIDATDAKLTGNGRKLFKIGLESPASAEISAITISWLDDSGEKTERIKIGGEIFWEGSALAGEVLDGEYTLLPSERKWFSAWFDSDMHDKSFEIIFSAKGCDDEIIAIGPFYKNNCANNDNGEGNDGCVEEPDEYDENGE